VSSSRRKAGQFPWQEGEGILVVFHSTFGVRGITETFRTCQENLSFWNMQGPWDAFDNLIRRLKGEFGTREHTAKSPEVQFRLWLPVRVTDLTSDCEPGQASSWRQCFPGKSNCPLGGKEVNVYWAPHMQQTPG
jgi:hypothetical protein